MRQQLDLNGPWEFQIDPAGTLQLEQIAAWRTIQVPGPWQAQFDDLRLVAGAGWYRRAIRIPAEWAGRTIVLHVGAADYFSEVWVDGQAVGTHEGGYLPFELDLTRAVAPGAEHTLVIRVSDPGPGDYDIFPQFPFAEIPHGKQSWYGPIGGIWQPVWIEARAPQHLSALRITPQGLSGRVIAALQLNALPEHGWLAWRCLAPDGQPVAHGEVWPDQPDTTLDFTIAQPALWAPDSPALYTLEVTLLSGDSALDRQEARFGIRTIEAREGRLWLNGRPLYLRGALDQDYYPEGLYTPPSLEYLRAQARQAKAMGLNCLRCHIKVPDPRYLQAADEEGILIWAEVPSWGRLSGRAGERVRETFAGMVARDWNHPSIVIWTLVNENWGTDLVNAASDRQWLAETTAWARQVDPTRLIVDNSACIPNFHVSTDIEDYHFYAAMPEGLPRWQAFVRLFADRSPFTFSPNGDATRTGQEPLIVSEFGNWGLPDLAALRRAYGERDPWWFITGDRWNPPVVWPQDVEARFAQAGLGAVFGDWSGLAEAAQWAQYRALKAEIEAMRAEPSLCGYVITEWSDLHWECNGLVDMARNPRVFARDLADLNADTLIVPRWERTAYWSGERVKIDLRVAHHGPQDYRNAVVRWSLEGNGKRDTLPLLSLPSGTVQPVGAILFDAPEVVAPTARTLVCWIALQDGPTLARTTQTITVYPRACAQAPVARRVWSGDPALREWLAQHGYVLDAETGLWIATQIDGETQRHIEQGGRALLCATEAQSLAEIAPRLQVHARRGTPWSGDWASSFAWVRPGVTRIPGGPLLDFGWQGAYPEHVITGLAAERTLAGLFVGWVHQAAALAGSLAVSRGALALTTFPVLPPDDSPARTVLLHDLIAAFAWS